MRLAASAARRPLRATPLTARAAPPARAFSSKPPKSHLSTSVAALDAEEEEAAALAAVAAEAASDPMLQQLAAAGSLQTAEQCVVVASRDDSIPPMTFKYIVHSRYETLTFRLPQVRRLAARARPRRLPLRREALRGALRLSSNHRIASP